jgi:membrane protein implicated in regulation of membrane protease activity
MNETLLLSTQFLVFASLAGLGLLVTGASFFFGGHDHDVDHGHDGVGHDHDTDGHDGPTVSFFSPKVIFTFIIGFGAAGAIATAYGKSGAYSTIAGLITGLITGFLALLMLRGFYSQQSSSSIQPGDAIGKTGHVATEIPPNGLGEVSLSVRGSFITYSAKAKGGGRLTKGTTVKVVQDLGGMLLVETAV